MSNQWPKTLPPLTENQKRIREEFMLLWHETLPKKFQFLEDFNHGFPVRERVKGFAKTLEIDAGIGAHLGYEDLSNQEYHALELRPDWAERIKQKYPKVQVTTGDCQKNIPFDDNFFDRVIAIHVLEHLVDLPSALQEINRVVKKEGQICVVIPCEGGMLYSLCRILSTKRMFEKKYKQSFDWLIQSEHVSTASEILDELPKFFSITKTSFFPSLLSSAQFNICIGLALRPLG